MMNNSQIASKTTAGTSCRTGSTTGARAGSARHSSGIGQALGTGRCRAGLVRLAGLMLALGLACAPAAKSPQGTPSPSGGTADRRPAAGETTDWEATGRGSQVVIYIRQPEPAALPLTWEIRKIALVRSDGTQIGLPGTEVVVKTSDFERGQQLLAITEAPAGAYTGMAIFTRSAYFEDTRAAIPDAANLVTVTHGFSVVAGDSKTILIAAELAPAGADRRGFRFQPVVSIEDEPAAPKGKLVYVANELSSNVSVIDKATKRVIKNVYVGSRPTALAAESRRNRLYIADSKAGAIYEMDMINQRLLKATQIGFTDEPVHIEPLPAKDMLMVVNFGTDTVYLVDTFTLEIVDTVEVGDGPVDAAYSAIWDLAFVVNELSNTVSVIDLGLEEPAVDTTLDVGLRPSGITIDDSMGWLYVANRSSTDLMVIKLETIAIERSIPVGIGAGDIAFDPYGRRLFLAMMDTDEILCVDPYTGVTIYAVRLPGSPGELMFDLDEKKLYAAVPTANTVVVVDTIARTVQNWIETGESPSSMAIRL
jgi:YVTN family beta-propeller protein